MTPARKNWKSEIAWLRHRAKQCEDLSLHYRGLIDSEACQSILALSTSLYYRADWLEKAKTPLSP